MTETDPTWEEVAAAFKAAEPALLIKKCAHCGQVCGDYAGGLAGVMGHGLALVLCHPNDPARPDCYRRVTVYHEEIGALKQADPKPAGIESIIGGMDVFAQLHEIYQRIRPDS